MTKERLPDGRIIEGGPSNVRGKVTLSREELKIVKSNMYRDFLLAKKGGQISLSYTFDLWLRDSMNMLRGVRQADIKTELMLGKVSQAEFDALDEMRLKMISAILQMDISDMDKYGIQYIDPSATEMKKAQVLVPEYRKNKVRFHRDPEENSKIIKEK